MNLVILGASGFIGTALTTTALARGHQVKALVRDTTKLAALAAQYPTQLQVQAIDVLASDAQAGMLAEALRGADVVLSAFSGHSDSDVAGYYQQGFASILQAVAQAGSPRLLVVGGAASLQLPDGSLLLNSPDFPPAYLGSAQGAYWALQQLKQSALDWSYLSPAAEIFPGAATGTYRLGGDQLLTDASGHSRISTGDYADALLQEAEQPAHRQQRFSIAY